jgi:phosphate transport system substrate-binding protein
VLFIYAKKDHLGLAPGMVEYLTEFTSQEAIGKEGYLLDKGLVGLDECDVKAGQAAVLNWPLVDIDSLK